MQLPIYQAVAISATACLDILKMYLENGVGRRILAALTYQIYCICKPYQHTF